MEHELDPGRLDIMARSFRGHTQKRILKKDLWRYFAEAFPGRPQGVAEARWLLNALQQLAERGVIELPSAHGRCWESCLGISIPTSVTLVMSPVPAKDNSWHEYPWHSRLTWVADLDRLPPDQIAFLNRVQEGLVHGWFDEPAPFKYRSLQLAGDEKRLGLLLKTNLFLPGRLSLELLGCQQDLTPLAWERISDQPRLIIFENTGAFMVARQVLNEATQPPYGMIALGNGRSIVAAITWLTQVKHKIESIYYVGDLDRAGIDIALAAQSKARSLGLSPFKPASELHRAMLSSAAKLGYPEGWPDSTAPRSRPEDLIRLLSFLDEDYVAEAGKILALRHRIPEEVLGSCEFAAAWSLPK